MAGTDEERTRCWRCGIRIPVANSRRRDVNSKNPLLYWFALLFGDHQHGMVDLCERCTWWNDHADWIWGAIAAVLAVAILIGLALYMN